MANIYNATEGCCFEERNVLFDTNVWIYINGDMRPYEQRIYSNYYASVLSKNNTVITNEFVLSEMFNRLLKIEYELFYDDKDMRLFKRRRRSCEFRDRMEFVRDTCLNVLEECEFVSLSPSKQKISDCIEDTCIGELDFTNSILVDQCISEDFVFVSHDGDFANQNIDFVTANKRFI